jgi:integrase
MSDELPTYLNKERAIPFSPKAIYDSTRYVNLFENFIGKKPFNLIDRLDVKNYIEHRMKSVSSNSVRRELRSLSAIWNFSKLNADLDIRNPFANHSLPNQPKKNRATAQLEEVQRLYKLIIESDKVSYVEHLCLIVLLTGCRLAEAWGLEPTDINEERLAFKIQHNKTRRIKNKISTRELPLTPTIHKAITKYFDSAKPNSAASASAALGKFYKSNGFKFSSHSLRHFMRDTLDKLGARASEIDGICGWSSGSMRDQYGNRDLTEQLRQRLQAVENHISESKPQFEQ